MNLHSTTRLFASIATLLLLGAGMLSAQGACVTGQPNNAFTNTAFASQTGTFTATFDATPSIAGIHAIIALSSGAQTAYTGFANLVQFNNSGDIDARNGGAYAAATVVPDPAGVVFHFRLVVNVPAHTYSIYVTPGTGTEQTIGVNYAFRTEQNTVASLDHWGVRVNTPPGGTLQVCNFSTGGTPPPPDFTIAATPSSQTVTRGNSTTYTVNIGAVNGFAGNVTLAASGLPTGATASFSPNPVTGGSGSSTMTVTTSATTPIATSTLTITGTSGSLSHSTTVGLTVTNTPPPPDFSISAAPASQTVTQGSGTTYTVTIAPLNGFTGSVTLSAAGAPSGAGFSPNPVTGGSGSSTLTVTTSSTTPTGSSTITITGTSGSLSHSVTVGLTVNPQTTTGDFTIFAASGAPSVDPGNPYPYAVWVKPVNGFSGVVTFSVSGLPSGATGAFRTADRANPLGASVPTNINGGPAESTLTVSTSSSTPAGTYPLTITAMSNGLTHTTSASLTVNPAPRAFPISCGGSNDTATINGAIAAANAGGGGVVVIPAGATCSAASIHMMSNVRLQLGAGSTLRGHTGIDGAESLGCSGFQDFGHSHFHNAMIWGEDLTNIAIEGSGTINGNGVLSTGTPGSGGGDKIISLRNSTNVTITGITLTNGGHFALLTNGTNNMSVSNVTMHDASNRDAFNLISGSNVVVDNCDIEGSDDAMVLKSDWALCHQGTSANIYISNSHIFSTGNNATQFGSETCGNFSNVYWANLNLTEGGKAGIGVTSNDGAIIDNVVYDNISVSHAGDPIYLKIDNQGRCPQVASPGAIRNISISNVNATVSESGSTGTFTCTINGMSGHHINNVMVTNTEYTSPGGRPASDASINPPENNNWVPSSLGTRPSYGWFIRHADNITIDNRRCLTSNCVAVNFSSSDGRPAALANEGSNISFYGFVYEEPTGPCDLTFGSVAGQPIAGYYVDPTTVSTGGLKPRICPMNGSTATPPPGPFPNPQ